MYQKHFKRFFDLAIAAVAIFVLLPLFVVIVILLAFTGEGEVFYFQKRIGYQKRYFQMWKFATMLKESPNLPGGYLTVRDDPRVTRVGYWLRKTKLNELPQLINVLLGDMSLVGPRPLVDETFEAYNAQEQQMVSSLKPGVTGIGSIVFRDEEKLLANTNMPPREFYFQHIAPYKAALEAWYARHISFRTDCLLLFLTIWTIFFSNSNWHFKIFKSLPTLPKSLDQ
ncbi:MAG TPA: sugar transferase [Saprospiraceae bacterium]|nr:sugar transferase [Saprospiraceae bacterium]HMP23686.1 sugar transferase [Saprospiraceae bacterium]